MRGRALGTILSKLHLGKAVLKRTLFVAAAAAFVAGSTMAKSPFEGAYVEVATGYQKTSVGSVTANNMDGGGAYSMIAPAQSTGKTPLMLGLGYTVSVAPQFVFGLGAQYQAIRSTSSTTTFIVPEGCSGQCGGTQYQISNQYSIFVAPGYAIDQDRLAYFKVGYSSQTVQSSYQQGHANDPANGASFGTSVVSGYILGIGYKQMIAGGLYGFLEGNYYGYGKASFNNSLNNGVGKVQTTVSGYNPLSSALNFLVGVGYAF